MEGKFDFCIIFNPEPISKGNQLFFSCSELLHLVAHPLAAKLLVVLAHLHADHQRKGRNPVSPSLDYNGLLLAPQRAKRAEPNGERSV